MEGEVHDNQEEVQMAATKLPKPVRGLIPKRPQKQVDQVAKSILETLANKANGAARMIKRKRHPWRKRLGIAFAAVPVLILIRSFFDRRTTA